MYGLVGGGGLGGFLRCDYFFVRSYILSSGWAVASQWFLVLLCISFPLFEFSARLSETTLRTGTVPITPSLRLVRPKGRPPVFQTQIPLHYNLLLANKGSRWNDIRFY